MLVKSLSEAIHAVMQNTREVLVVDYSEEHPVARTRPLEDFPEVEAVPRRHRVTVGKGGQTLVETLDTSILVKAEPLFEIDLPYSAHMPVVDDGMYPPSSFAWYGRMAPDEKRVRFIVQCIVDNEKRWLTILDPDTMEVYESHTVHQFESSALQVRGATEYVVGYTEEMSTVIDPRSDRRTEVLSVLDEPPPTWEQLWGLTKEYHVKGLTIGQTMRDTLTHLVPADWPDNIREEWMALLAWTLKEVPYGEDPVSIHAKLSKTPVLFEALPSHFIREALGVDQPEYVRVIHNPPSTMSRPVHEPAMISWKLALEALGSGRSLDSPEIQIATRWAQKLNESGHVVTGHPVTRSMARRSRKYWIERCVLMQMRMGLQCRPRVHALGLRSLIYIGSAHRWPHKHMAWKATLGLPKSSLHVQEILIPTSQLEAVRRVRSGLRECVWYSRVINLTTSIPIGQLMKTANRKRTLKQLKREFGQWRGKTPYTPTETDIRVIDGSCDTVELTDLELPTLKDDYGFTVREFHNSMERLVSQGVVFVNYQYSEESYPPRLVTLHGEEGSVLGLVRAVLKYTPMCSAYVLDDQSAFFVTNLPPGQLKEMSTSLGTWAAEKDVNLDIHQIGGYLNLRRNLFKRLWKGDHWDEDISAILSQVRKKGKK